MKTFVKRLIPFAAISSFALVAACSEPEPEVTPAPEEPAVTAEVEAPTEAEATEEAEEELEEGAEQEVEEPDAPTVGTREAPLALGENRKLANDSAWTVGVLASDLDAFEAVRSADPYQEAPEDGEVFVLANVSIETDAAALADQGHDISDGAEPGYSVLVEFVGNEGRSYDGTSGTWCYTDNLLTEAGVVYDDGVVVTGDVCIAVPEGEVEGGLWRLSNLVNDAVWVEID